MKYVSIHDIAIDSSRIASTRSRGHSMLGYELESTIKFLRQTIRNFDDGTELRLRRNGRVPYREAKAAL